MGLLQPQGDEGTYARIVFAPYGASIAWMIMRPLEEAIENIVRVTNVRIAHMAELMPFYASPWADLSLEQLSPGVI